MGARQAGSHGGGGGAGPPQLPGRCRGLGAARAYEPLRHLGNRRFQPQLRAQVTAADALPPLPFPSAGSRRGLVAWRYPACRSPCPTAPSAPLLLSFGPSAPFRGSLRLAAPRYRGAPRHVGAHCPSGPSGRRGLGAGRTPSQPASGRTLRVGVCRRSQRLSALILMSFISWGRGESE